MNKVLHLTLKKQWFDMILSGTKKEEYREVKNYWMKRLAGIEGCGTSYNFTLLNSVENKCIEYTHIVFKNGYATDAPVMTVECKGIEVKQGNKKWGAPDYRVFAIKLGKVLETANLRDPNPTSKKCAICKEVKVVSEFNRNKNSIDKLASNCKECKNKKNLAYHRTPRGVATSLYGHSVTSSKRRGHQPPTYTKAELSEWLFSQPNFQSLYDNWVVSGYSRWEFPSVDRLDDYKGYSFDNIRLVSWDDNNKKGYRARRSGINNKVNKGVIGTSLVDGKKHHYHSIEEAARQVGGSTCGISKCCKGLAYTAHNHTWEFQDSNLKKETE